MEATTINGLTYTPVDDNTKLIYDSEGKVTGISSGTVEITLENSTNPKITVEGTTPLNFSASNESDGIKFSAGNTSFVYVSGEAKYSADEIYYPAGEISVKLTNAILSPLIGNINFSVPSEGVKIPVSDTNKNIALNLPEKLVATLSGGIASGSVALQGAININLAEKQVTINEGSVFAVNGLSVSGITNDINMDITALANSVLALEGINVVIKDGASIKFVGGGSLGLAGDITLSGGDLSIDLLSILTGNTGSLTLDAGTTFTFTPEGGSTIIITAPESNSVSISSSNGVLSINTQDEQDDNGLNVKVGDSDALSFNAKGTVQIDTNNKTLKILDGTNIAISLDKGSVMKLKASSDSEDSLGNDSVLNLKANGDISSTFDFSNDGIVIGTEENESVFDIQYGDLSATFDLVGTAVVNPSTQKIIFKDGTNSTVKFGEYTAKITADGDAQSLISINSDGLTFKPEEGDGSLDIEIIGNEGSVKANIEIVKGAFTLNENNTLSVEKDTELKIDFGNDYVISFTATDEAGGTLGIGTEGITYTPNNEDGGLEISVTRDGETRTASLDVTGTVTYNLDGSISLTEGTVVKNVFEDGKILTITANTDASGTITFNPEGGLTITPAEPESLTVTLKFADEDLELYEITNIDGSITYSGGTVTAGNGTQLSLKYDDYTDDSKDYTADLKITGGNSSIEFNKEYAIYTADEGATLNIVTNDNIITELQNGSLKAELYTAKYVLQEGTIFNSNDTEITLVLEKAGKYTLNGNEIETNKDNVEVYILENYAITFDANAGVSFGGEEISGNATAVIADGELSLVMKEAGTATLGGKTFELTEDVEEGVTISLTEEGFKVSHALTESEVADDPNGEESDIDKIFVETLSISGDENYSVELNSWGIQSLSGISDGANIKVTAEFDGAPDEGGTWFNIVTDSVGTITLGNKAYEISSDENVVLKVGFLNDRTANLNSVKDLESGYVGGDFNGTHTINEEEITISEGADNAKVYNDAGEIINITGIEDGAEVTFESENVAVSGINTVTVNGVTYSTTGDSDGILVSDKEIVGLDENASLTVSESGTYTVNSTPLEVTENDVVVGLNDSYAYISKGNQINSEQTTAEIIEALGVEEENAVIIPADASGSQRETLDNDGEAAIIENTKSPVTIVGGRGNDTVVNSGANTTFNMARGGDDKVVVLGGNIKLENYNPRGESGIQLTAEDMNEGVKFNDGKIELANGTVELTNNFVNLYDIAGNKELIGFATNEDKRVDASSLTEGISIIGGGEFATNEVAKATLKGGSGDDSIIGGKEAKIDGGAGNDYIEVSDNGGSAITYSEGNDTINNFNFVGEKGADTLHNVIPLDVAVENGNVILTTEKGTITINDAENKSIALDKDVTLQVGENIKYDGAANEYWATGENAVVTVDDDYSGEKPEINLSKMTGDVKNVDLSNYEGEAEITGNSGDNVLIASNGGSTVDGGAGNDSILGGAGADEFISDSGDDTISGFEFGTEENSDKLNAKEMAVNKVKVDGDDVILVTENGSTQIENAAGQTMQFQSEHTNNEKINAQFADTLLSVNEEADFYWASGNNVIVTVSDQSDTETTLELDLSNADFNNAEQLSFYGDIKAIDASTFKGEANLKGNAKNNIIIASAGGSTLNGGTRNDKLIGGAGADTFVYELGNGKDTISNFKFGTEENSDILDLSSVSINKAKVYDDDVVLEVDGGSVKIEGAAGKTIQLKSANTNNEIVNAQFDSGVISVNDEANFYWAAGKNATVSLENYSAEEVKIDLSNSDYNNAEQLSFYGDIKEIDASGYKGYAILSGNDKNNIITANNYCSDLWGGNGGNDTLIGGDNSKYSSFYYISGDGNDVIKNSKSDDLIHLGGMTLDDIMKVETTDSEMKLKFKDGGSLSIETNESPQFIVDDHTSYSYTYNKTTGEFDSHEAGSGGGNY